MSAPTKSPPARYTLGRKSFAKISEVEGIKPSDALEAEFREFDRQGLSPKARRARLARKYGRAD